LQEENKKILPDDVQLADEHLWRPRNPRIAHFQRLSTVESVDESLDAAARAETPGSMEYAHLGTHKLGSLIVMNASTSPTHSIVSKTMAPSKSTTEFTRDEDFFTASEGEGRPSSVEDDDFGTSLPQKQYTDLDGLSSQKERMGRLPHRFMGSAANTTTRSGSPLKHEVREQSKEYEDLEADIDILLGPPTTQPMPANNEVSLTDLSFESMSDDEPRMPKFSPARSHQSALSLASEYIADLPPSPYASAVDISQYSTSELESEATQLTHNLIQPDEGFYDVPPEFEEPAQECVGEPDRRPSFVREITPETALQSHPPRDMPLKPAIKPVRPSPQTISDSGYSSGYDSLASSARSDQRPPINHLVFPTNQHVPNSPEDTAAVYTFLQTPSSSGPEAALQSLQGSEPWLKPESTPSNVPARSKSWRESMRKSLPRLLSSESATSLESKHSFDSKSTAKQPKQQKKQKKLQKKRPLSHQPVSVGLPHPVENRSVPRVPSVPSEVSARFTVRLATSPNMEHLDRTYEDITAGNSRFGSINPGPNTLSNTLTFPDAKKASKLLCDEPPPTPPHRYGLGTLGDARLFKIIDDDEEVYTGIADFGTVDQSLDNSPYDVSTSGFIRRPQSAAAAHPYQLSSLTPQFGPRRGWDDETAAKMSQMRIRERVAAATASNMNEQSTNAKSRLSGRPRSHHGSSGFKTPRRIPSMESDIDTSQWPRSMYGDTSVPAPELDLPVIPPRQRPTFERSKSIPCYETLYLEHEQMPLPEPVWPGDMPETGTVAQPAWQIHETALTPMPPASNSLDWSHQANIWRKRKLSAQTTVETTCSSATLSPTTTNTGILSPPHPHPQQQTQHQALARHLLWLPPSANQLQQQFTAPHASTSAMQDVRNIPTLPTYSEEGIFGRYGGGTRHGTHYRGLAGNRDVSLATGGMRKEWGIDMGDVPVTRLAL
jgi:hypothetical protein